MNESNDDPMSETMVRSEAGRSHRELLQSSFDATRSPGAIWRADGAAPAQVESRRRPISESIRRGRHDRGAAPAVSCLRKNPPRDPTSRSMPASCRGSKGGGVDQGDLGSIKRA